MKLLYIYTIKLEIKGWPLRVGLNVTSDFGNFQDYLVGFGKGKKESIWIDLENLEFNKETLITVAWI